MSAGFSYRAAPEHAYGRKARLVVTLIDGVTLQPVHAGLELKVTGLTAKPILSAGGRFVWFAEPGATPARLEIDPGLLPYAPRALDVPPLPPPPPPPALVQTVTHMPLELGPSVAYPFGPGITGLRGTVIRNLNDDPLQRLDQVDIRLQWLDDTVPGPFEPWLDAPTESRTNAKGDFAAIVRLATNQIARTDPQGRMRVRVAATRAGNTRFSQELQIPFEQVTDAQQRFAWDDLQP